MLQPVLLFALIGLSLAQCPAGFTDDGSGNCYSGWYDGIDHTSAYARCAYTNSFMFDILNAFSNSAVQSSAQGRDRVWLGLTCLNSSIATCQWDDGRQVKADGYTNFVNGKPNPAAGACVYMQVSSGLWYNSDCTTEIASAKCQNVPALSVTVPYCTDGSIYFRGNCYLGTLVHGETDGAAICGSGCGTMASIHSDGENAVVADVAGLNKDTKYGFLSLTKSPSYKWADGSDYDYNHWGYQNDGLGTCASIAGANDAVKKGYWISTPCSSSTPVNTICKKNVTNSCDPPIPTASCDGTTILSNSGQFYSPGYPGASGPTSCEFVLAVNVSDNNYRQAVTVALNFLDISLDKNSFIYIYNNIFDNTPATTITDTKMHAATFLSTGNMMKVVFETTGSGNNFFRAYFGDGRVPCSNGTYYGSGTYMTPNYPDPYPRLPDNCEVRFLSSKKSVTLFLQDVDLYYNARIYDGNGNVLVENFATKTNFTVGSLTPVLRLYISGGYNSRSRGILSSFVSN